MGEQRTALTASLTHKRMEERLSPERTVLARCAPGRTADCAETLRKHGLEVLYSGVRVIAFRATEEIVSNLSKSALIEDIQPARPLFPAIDAGRSAIGLLPTPAPDEDGAGVVLAVVDTGLDATHPDFQRTPGRTSLEALVWVPAESPTMPGEAKVYARDDIERALQARGGLPCDENGHGTHCASIAAGNGRGSSRKFIGVAPGADLIAVGMSSMDNASVLIGIQEVLRIAGQRPTVFSLSLSTQMGSHDGSDPLEIEIDELSGPGRIFVVAAGNDADKRIHWSGHLETPLSITFILKDTAAQGLLVYAEKLDELEAVLVLPNGERIPADETDVLHSTGCGSVSVVMQRRANVNAVEVMVSIYDAEEDLQWELVLSSRTGNGRALHAWAIASSPHLQKNILEKPASTCTVSIPGTAHRAITVGAAVSKTTFESRTGPQDDSAIAVGDVASFSGRGPTRDGRPKPDLLAPGQYVTAALSSTSSFATEDLYEGIRHPLEGYFTMDGTSMATPFVAGAVALALAREPSLTPEDLKGRILAASSELGIEPAQWHLRVAELLRAG